MIDQLCGRGSSSSSQLGGNRPSAIKCKPHVESYPYVWYLNGIVGLHMLLGILFFL
jgi:hypothetical protein